MPMEDEVVTQAAAVGLTALLTAWNTRHNQFVWDDRAAVLGNAGVRRHDTSIWRLFKDDFWGTSIDSVNSHKSYRPLTVLTFRWNHYWHGIDPYGYHLVNVVVHAICSVLVWRTAEVIMRLYAPKKRVRVGSIIAGLLFALHPIHCDAVASVVGRADLLCTMFALIGFHYYVDGTTSQVHSTHQKVYYVLAGLGLGVAASLCKELGFTTFALYCAYDIMRGIKEDGVDRFRWRRRASRVGSVVLFTLVCAMLRVSINGEHRQMVWNKLANNIVVQESKLTRVLSYAHVHAWYLWKLVWPGWLSFDYGFNTIPVIESILDPRNLLTLLAYAVVATGVAHGIHTVKTSPVLLMISFGAITFIPASNLFFPVGTVVAERLLYFPSAGFCFLVGYLMEQVFDIHDRVTLPGPLDSVLTQRLWQGLPRILYSLMGLILLAASYKSYVHNAEWRTEKSLFDAALTVVPENLKVLNNNAKVYLNSDPLRAIRYGLLSTGMMPNQTEAYLNLGLAYGINHQDFLAIRHLMKSVAFSKWSASSAGYTGAYLYRYWSFQHDEQVTLQQALGSPTVRIAKQLLDKAVLLKSEHPDHYFARSHLGYIRCDRLDARNHMQTALRVNEKIQREGIDMERMLPMGDIVNALAAYERLLGNTDTALALLLDAMKTDSSNPRLFMNAGVIYFDRKQQGPAKELLERALELGNNPSFFRDAGRILEGLQQYHAAVVFLRKGEKLNPEQTELFKSDIKRLEAIINANTSK
ncbi:hypothetical protein Poli38472_000294 [Pythium oligandrum]|uniref:DUF1736 domain-containing protein n=1 Tax=Pythium oligandrum TaxID=41045 RepID=A0A8K1CDF3_PYTOL|nr:hypothetical protein Poli38472_000294 [Pythium oligandrum]|eukprot:TMW60252.1 hypothetical protein Poli38472_000294 [Pythium oligandrum]